MGVSIDPHQLLAELQRVQRGLITEGRVTAGALLGEPSRSSRIALAERTARRFTLAGELGAFLARDHHARPTSVAWSTSQAHQLVEAVAHGSAATVRLADSIEAVTAVAVDELANRLRDSPLDRPTRWWLYRIRDELDTPAGVESVDARDWLTPTTDASPPSHTLRGPTRRPLDDDQELDPDHRTIRQARFTPDPAGASSYFAFLSAQESTAADLCCLSIIEWDHLPLDFYADMASQTLDEIQHAEFFFHAAQTLAPQPFEVVRLSSAGTFYEAIANATLLERLVLMHHDTERPGVANLRRIATLPAIQRHEAVANGIRTVARDEQKHAALGARWLRYLEPDDTRRAEAIESAHLLRTVLLLTSVAHNHTDVSLDELVDAVLAGAITATSS